MKNDLIQLRDLMIKIISEYDINKIDINLAEQFEIHSESECDYYRVIENPEEIKVRVGIDTMITIAKDNFKITDNLENMINKLKEENQKNN